MIKWMTQPHFLRAVMTLIITTALTACEKDYDIIYLNKETPSEMIVRMAEETSRTDEVSTADETPVHEQPKVTLTLDGDTGPYKRGSKASIAVMGAAETEYILQVFYSSGESKASGLGAKVSDEGGSVSWSWTVGAATKPGVYYAVVTGGGESLTVEFEVTE